MKYPMSMPHVLPALAVGVLWIALCQDLGYPLEVIVAGGLLIGYLTPWLLDH